MAGAGFKLFTTGEVLTSSDANTYLAQQVCMVFDSSSARTTAIGANLAEGMLTYLKDTNAVEVYDGSSFVGFGDLTAVSAGTNIDVTSGTGPIPSVALAIDAAVEMGSDGSGVAVTFYSSTAGDTMLWDASEEKLVITGTNGQNALEVADGDVSITDSLTVSGGLVAPLAINAQTGTSYTFVAADAGKLVTSSNGSAQTVTIPPNSSVAFAIGTQIMVQNLGSANATLAQGSGVTIQSKDSNKEIDGQFAGATCIKTATDTWSLIGALK